MTFKDLLQRTPFDRIVEFLTTEGCKAGYIVRQYKEEYDEIRRQSDAPGSQNITIAVEKFGKGKTRMVSYGINVEALEPNANKNLIVNLPHGYNEAEVCVTLLDYTRRHGCTTRVKKRFLGDLSDPYVRMAHALYWKSRARYLPKHLRKQRIPGTLTPKQLIAYRKRIARRNRTKKKRDRRMEHRLDFLNRQGIRKRTIDWFTATAADRPIWIVSRENQNAFSHMLFDYVCDAKYVFDYTYQSHTKSEDGRLAYLLDLMRYDPPYLDGSILSVAVQTSTAHPITEEEDETLAKLIEAWKKDHDFEPDWMLDTYDDTLGFDMEIKLLLIL